MLQRIQTVYMILSILVMGALYMWFPVVEDAAKNVVIDKSEPLVLGLILAPVVLTLISIFNFKKRQHQFVLNRLSIILNFVGVLLPIISIVFLVLANKAIKRDEDLVKSVDRLR